MHSEIPVIDRSRRGRRSGRQSKTTSDLITVSILSDRESLLKELLPRLAREQDIEVVGQCTGNPALLSVWVEWRQPKLLLLDKLLLDQTSAEPLRTIRTKVPQVRVLLLGGEVCPGLVEIVRHRFHGYLPASCPPEAYVKAIRAVSRGDVWLPRNVLAKALSDLMQTFSGGDPQAECDRSSAEAMNVLTDREQQIVALLSQGLSNKEIGRRLGIMEDTVKKHLQNVFDKLGVRRRSLLILRLFGGQLANA